MPYTLAAACTVPERRHGSHDQDAEGAARPQTMVPIRKRPWPRKSKAKTTVLTASHLVMLSHPTAVARVIEEAAAAARN